VILGGGHYPLFSWIMCVKWVFKGGILYLIQVLNNTVYYLIFQFLQFYVGLCLVLIFFPTIYIICYFILFYFLLCILLVIFWLNWEYNIIFIISFFLRETSWARCPKFRVTSTRQWCITKKSWSPYIGSKILSFCSKLQVPMNYLHAP
jgi:hypothetical protein